MINKLYFCEKCRRELADAADLHYVEENSDRGFCSETCITEFYRPYAEKLEKEEAQFRSSLKLTQSDLNLLALSEEKFLRKTLEEPDEIWEFEDETGKIFYTHILKFRRADIDNYSIVICSHAEETPSFVYYRTMTKSAELMRMYQRDSKVELVKRLGALEEEISDEDLKTAEDLLNEVELKKSSILADYLVKREETDIPFESFPSYDEFLETTISQADEVYEFEDESGDILNTSIKSFKKGESDFFYIAISLPHESKVDGVLRKIQVPIIGFPSHDKDLYPKYAVGKRLDFKISN